MGKAPKKKKFPILFLSLSLSLFVRRKEGRVNATKKRIAKKKKKKTSTTLTRGDRRRDDDDDAMDEDDDYGEDEPEINAGHQEEDEGMDVDGENIIASGDAAGQEKRGKAVVSEAPQSACGRDEEEDPPLPAHHDHHGCCDDTGRQRHFRLYGWYWHGCLFQPTVQSRNSTRQHFRSCG